MEGTAPRFTGLYAIRRGFERDCVLGNVALIPCVAATEPRR